MPEFMTPALRRDLELRAHGIDPQTNLRVGPNGVPLVSPEEQRSAMAALHKLDREAVEDARAARVLDETRELEHRKLDEMRDVEQRKLDIEEERVKIEKVQAVARLIEAAGQAGVPSDRLLETLAQATQHLLGGPTPERPLLDGPTSDRRLLDVKD